MIRGRRYSVPGFRSSLKSIASTVRTPRRRRWAVAILNCCVSPTSLSCKSQAQTLDWVSLTHDCVQSQIRWVLYGYYFNSTFTIMDGTWTHTKHCMDIIRRSLMCQADHTLMPRDNDFEEPGVGQTRQCNNFDALKAWAAANRLDWDLIVHKSTCCYI